VHRGGVALLLPQLPLGAPTQLPHARPIRIFVDERGVAAKARAAIRVAQHEPFDKLLRDFVVKHVLDDSRFAGLALADEFERPFDRAEISGQRLGWLGRRDRNLSHVGAAHFSGRALAGLIVCPMGAFRAFGRCGRLLLSRRGGVIRVLSAGRLLLARRCQGGMCKYGEYGEGKAVRNRPEALDHS
jgi:hypothetical protein